MDDVLSGAAARTGNYIEKEEKKIGKIYMRGPINNGKHDTRYRDRGSLKAEVQKILVYYPGTKGFYWNC